MLGFATASLAGIALYLGSAPEPSEIAEELPKPPEIPGPPEIAEPDVTPAPPDPPPSRVEAPPELELGVEPTVGAPDEPLQDDAARVIQSVVKKSQGRIQSCFEAALLQRPNLAGRVALGWSIVDGRVTDVRVVSNDTGEDALAVCMGKAVLTVRFPAEITAEVSEFPWVFHSR